MLIPVRSSQFKRDVGKAKGEELHFGLLHRIHRPGEVESHTSGEDLGDRRPEASTRRLDWRGLMGDPANVGPALDLIPGDLHEPPGGSVDTTHPLILFQPPPPVPRVRCVPCDDAYGNGVVTMVVQGDADD